MPNPSGSTETQSQPVSWGRRGSRDRSTERRVLGKLLPGISRRDFAQVAPPSRVRYTYWPMPTDTVFIAHFLRGGWASINPSAMRLRRGDAFPGGITPG